MEAIVLYSRVSTQKQEFLTQFEELKTWCEGKKFEVIELFGEKVSGYDLKTERIEFEKMKKYIEANNIKHIAVWDMSRFGRSMTRSLVDIKYFTDKGVCVHFKKEGISTISGDVMNTLLMANLSAMAEMERNTFIERGKGGRMTAVKNGRMIGYSTIPYGFKRNDQGKIAVNNEEAKVIKLIYDLAIKGKTLYGICQELNGLKIKTRRALDGKKSLRKEGNKIKETEIQWKPQTVARNIKRTINMGLRIYKGVEIKVPAIVTPEIWESAQQRFKDNIGYLSKPNRAQYEYLFKGKMRCGMCGRAMVTYHSKKDNVGYYLCTGISDMRGSCENGRYINSAMIDHRVFKSLFQTIDSENALSADTNKELGIEEKQNQIAYYRNEIENLKISHKRLIKKYVGNPDFSDDELNASELTIKNQITDCENKIKFIDNSLNRDNRVDISELLTSIYNSEDYTQKRIFIEKYIDQILVYKVINTNIKFENPLHKNEKIIYIEVHAFGNPVPYHIVLTPYSKNAIFYYVETLSFDKATATLTER